MTCTIEADHRTDREARAETCPNCGGVLTVNQDGWKICYNSGCGYSSPPGYAPPATSRFAGSVAALN